jgi:hypothetical protein
VVAALPVDHQIQVVADDVDDDLMDVRTPAMLSP